MRKSEDITEKLKQAIGEHYDAEFVDVITTGDELNCYSEIPFHANLTEDNEKIKRSFYIEILATY